MYGVLGLYPTLRDDAASGKPIIFDGGGATFASASAFFWPFAAVPSPPPPPVPMQGRRRRSFVPLPPVAAAVRLYLSPFVVSLKTLKGPASHVNSRPLSPVRLNFEHFFSR